MKKILLILIYFIGILYSLETLSFFFIKDGKGLSIKNMNNLKIEAVNKIKNFDKRQDFEAFKQVRNQKSIYPSYRLSKIYTLVGDHKNTLKNFLEEKILKEEKIPFRGPLNKLSLGSNEDGVREIITNDKYGFKNYNKIYENNIDIMIIGDSFAEGVPFGNEDDVSGIINLNSDYSSINYGIKGAGPLNSLGVLREYGKNFEPKNIFYFFYEGNDLKNLLDEKNTFLIKYLDRNFNQDLFNSQVEVQTFLNRFEELFDKIFPHMLEKEKYNKSNSDNRIVTTNNFIEHLKDIIELQNLKNIIIPKNAYYHRNKRLDYKTFEKIIIEMKHDVSKWDGKLTIVYLPDWIRYYKRTDISKKILKKRIKKIAIKNKVNFIDMDYVFSKNKLDNVSLFNLGIYGHYTKRGYKIVAETIIDKLN